MLLTPLYVGEKKREGFFNIPPKKKTSIFVKNQNEKNLAELVIEKALSNLKEKEDPKK